MNQVEQQIASSKRAPITYKCANGVVLEIRAVPSHVTREVLRNIKEPKPPSFFNEAKGRTETNELDPEYIEAMERFKNDQVDLTNRAYLLHTKIFGNLPEDVEGPDGEEWSSFQELLGIQVHPVGSRERYVDWLKFHVLIDADFKDLMTAIYTAGGLVTEEEVNAAVASFPDNKNGTTLTDISAGE